MQIKSFFTALAALCVFAAFVPGMAGAEPVMRAVPAVAVAEDIVPDRMGSGIVFAELFTSERCPFCPQAERNFRDLVGQDGVIGYTCSVDYFSTGTDPLARSFCAARQDFYMSRLQTGPRYTPQLILNGVSHLSGHEIQRVAAAVKGAQQNPARTLSVMPGVQSGTFDVILPVIEQTGAHAGPYLLRLALVRKIIDDSRGIHTNQIDKLVNGGDWTGAATVWTIDPAASMAAGAGADAFIVFVQSKTTGRIVAAAMGDMAQ